MAGTVNGGAAELNGEIDVTTIGDPRGRVTMSARNVALEYPEGLQTESNANLTLTLAAAGATLAGRVDVLGGSYREPLLVSSQVLSGLRQGIDSPAPMSPFLSRLRLDLSLASVEDVRIDNNYGRLDLSTRLRIVGTVERPGVIGRIEASPDGEIYLAGNTYRDRAAHRRFREPARHRAGPQLSRRNPGRQHAHRGRADVRGDRRL